jgi:hypothetical protein
MEKSLLHAMLRRAATVTACVTSRVGDYKVAVAAQIEEHEMRPHCPQIRGSIAGEMRCRVTQAAADSAVSARAGRWTIYYSTQGQTIVISQGFVTMDTKGMYNIDSCCL